MGLCLDLVEGLLEHPHVRAFLYHHPLGDPGIIGDGGQRLVHLVGNAGGHFTHGGQARGMGKLIALFLNQLPGILQRLFIVQFGGDIPEYNNRTVELVRVQFRG